MVPTRVIGSTESIRSPATVVKVTDLPPMSTPHVAAGALIRNPVGEILLVIGWAPSTLWTISRISCQHACPSG